LRELREHPDKHIVSGIAEAHEKLTGEKKLKGQFGNSYK